MLDVARLELCFGVGEPEGHTPGIHVKGTFKDRASVCKLVLRDFPAGVLYPFLSTTGKSVGGMERRGERGLTCSLECDKCTLHILYVYDPDTHEVLRSLQRAVSLHREG
jgi:hypothetical protein